MANGDGVVTEPDVRAAQTTVDAWVDALASMGEPKLNDVDQRFLRGLIAARFADVRTAGYLEGLQRGRIEAAHVVLDALRGEGLAP